MNMYLNEKINTSKYTHKQIADIVDVSKSCVDSWCRKNGRRYPAGKQLYKLMELIPDLVPEKIYE